MKTFIAVIVLLLLLSLAGCGVYDGAFSPAEYQIKFLTPDDRPIDDVRLEVKDKDGSISHGYPVTDYYYGGIPTSDANGLVVFHHVRYSFEWGGIFFFGWKSDSPPEFDLLFTKNGELIHEVSYGELNRRISRDSDIVTRTVLVYDEETVRAARKHDRTDYPVHIVEEVMQFPVVEQTVVVANRN